MDSGYLYCRITLQHQVLSAPSSFSGERTKSWVTYATVPAHIKPSDGVELPFAKSFVFTGSDLIAIRYAPNIPLKGTDRILYNGYIFHINAILDGNLVSDDADFRHQWKTLLCTRYEDSSTDDESSSSSSS